MFTTLLVIKLFVGAVAAFAVIELAAPYADEKQIDTIEVVDTQE